MRTQTAMQALVELLNVNDIYKECMPYIIDIIDDVYLPMEKEQMSKVYEGILQNVGTSIKQSDLPTFEQYYNYTYNNERKEGDIR